MSTTKPIAYEPQLNAIALELAKFVQKWQPSSQAEPAVRREFHYQDHEFAAELNYLLHRFVLFHNQPLIKALADVAMRNTLPLSLEKTP